MRLAFTIPMAVIGGCFLPGTLLRGAVDYGKEIKPMLASACVQCHGGTLQKGGLRLDTAASALKGGDAGAAITPRDGAQSLLVQVLEEGHGDIPQMPYKRAPLGSEQISLIKEWIDEGAPAPAHEAPSIWRHWAFTAPVRPEPPVVAKAGYRRQNPIDAFINAALAKQNITPSPEADRITLIRRVSLDLVGLPPSIAEVDAFVSDSRGQTLTKRSWSTCWSRRFMAIAGAAGGLTRRSMRTRSDSASTRRVPSGRNATGW